MDIDDKHPYNPRWMVVSVGLAVITTILAHILLDALLPPDFRLPANVAYGIVETFSFIAGLFFLINCLPVVLFLKKKKVIGVVRSYLATSYFLMAWVPYNQLHNAFNLDQPQLRWWEFVFNVISIAVACMLGTAVISYLSQQHYIHRR